MFQSIHNKWPFLIILMMVFCHSNAATFCVSNSAQLVSTLITAQNNGEPDEIRLKTGNYVAPFQQSFNYFAPDSETFGLKITGGWIDVLNNPCSVQPGYALNTAIDANFGNRAFTIFPKGSQPVEISGLTFTNGLIDGESGGGLNITARTTGGFVPVGFDGTIIVENNAFISNQADFGSALYILEANKIIVRNNLIVGNHATLNSAVQLRNLNERGIYFTNNTVMNNSTDGTSNTVAAVSFFTAGSSQGFIANNILWNDNAALDLYFEDFNNSGDFHLYNNDIGSYLGFTKHEANNFSVPPEFQAGIEGDEGFTAMQRILNDAIDIGAIEAASDVIFEDGFEIF